MKSRTTSTVNFRSPNAPNITNHIHRSGSPSNHVHQVHRPIITPTRSMGLLGLNAAFFEDHSDPSVQSNLTTAQPTSNGIFKYRTTNKTHISSPKTYETLQQLQKNDEEHYQSEAVRQRSSHSSSPAPTQYGSADTSFHRQPTRLTQSLADSMAQAEHVHTTPHTPTSLYAGAHKSRGPYSGQRGSTTTRSSSLHSTQKRYHNRRNMTVNQLTTDDEQIFNSYEPCFYPELYPLPHREVSSNGGQDKTTTSRTSSSQPLHTRLGLLYTDSSHHTPLHTDRKFPGPLHNLEPISGAPMTETSGGSSRNSSQQSPRQHTVNGRVLASIASSLHQPPSISSDAYYDDALPFRHAGIELQELHSTATRKM